MIGMRPLKRAMLVIALGELALAANIAYARPSAPGPLAALPVAATASGASGTGKEGAPESKPEAAAPGMEGSAQLGANAPGGAGYTWRDKPAHGKYRKARASKVNPNLSQAKGPEFKVAADGTTHLTVQLSRKVEFRTETTRRRFTVNIAQAQVAVLNDRNPLITTHFTTPLVDARLVPHKVGVRLVIDLRESVTPQVSMKDVGAGAVQLEVVLPRSSRGGPAPAHSTRSNKNAGAANKARPHVSPVTPRSGMGPLP